MLISQNTDSFLQSWLYNPIMNLSFNFKVKRRTVNAECVWENTCMQVEAWVCLHTFFHRLFWHVRPLLSFFLCFLSALTTKSSRRCQQIISGILHAAFFWWTQPKPKYSQFNRPSSKGCRWDRGGTSQALLKRALTKKSTSLPRNEKKFSHHVVVLMPMESQVRFRSPQNVFRASQHKSAAASQKPLK